MKSSLFVSLVENYAAYRPPLPAEAVQFAIQHFHLDGHGTLLDLGCGTGQSTTPWLDHFEHIIACDSDPDMINKARQIAAHIPGAEKIRWLAESAENAIQTAPSLRLAIACRAFHWMDQAAILKSLIPLLQPEGHIAIMGDGSLWTGTDSWQVVTKQTVQVFLGEKRKARSGTYSVPTEPYETLLSRQGFVDVEVATLTLHRRWHFNEIVGYLYSTTFAAPDLFGDRVHEFEEQLFEQFGRPSSDEVFTENVEFTIKHGTAPRIF